MSSSSPLILHIESSGALCSVALSKGEELLGERVSYEPRSHASIISVLTEELFEKLSISLEECDAVAVSGGPGSYTGLRVGVSFAKGLSFGASKPLIAIDTLEIIATLCREYIREAVAKSIGEKSIEESGYTIVPMIDARRMEVYSALFSSKLERLTQDEALILGKESFSTLLNERRVLFCGDGAAKFSTLVESDNAKFIEIELTAKGMISSALRLFKESSFADVAYYQPLYLKEFKAGVSKKNLLFQ